MSTTKHILTAEQRTSLIEGALEARKTAYSPRVGFRVGAALLAPDGTLVFGANVTCKGVGNSCAERTAVYKGATAGYRSYLGLAVSSDTRVGISPCGFCRQVLSDFCPPHMTILLVPASYDSSTSKTVTVLDCAEGKPLDALIETTMGEMLPLAYGDDDYLAPRPKALEDTTQFRA